MSIAKAPLIPPITRNNPSITRKRSLTINDLKNLNLPLTFENNNIVIYKSLTGWKLKKPLTIPTQKLLDANEIGLIEYIIKSCLNERPSIIPYIFDNQSMLKLAHHFLRHLSGSPKSCLTYSVNTQKYAHWLGHSPDDIIRDIKPVGAIADPLSITKHCDFLNQYLADLQDAGLKPGAIINCIKAAKTFYNVHKIKVQLDGKLKRAISYKDRAPTPEEITKMLDMSATREAFIIAALASGGFREGTFCKLQIRHVQEDLENNIIPLHIHIEADITKGKYHDYDTFLNAESVNLLKLYLKEREIGTYKIPPEKLTPEAPLIRNTRKANEIVGINEKTLRNIIHTTAVKASVAKQLPNSWMYNVRTHSLRKFFKTQLTVLGVHQEYVEYMMGHTISTYDDVQSLGLETLRNIYASAGLAIRPKTQANRIEQLKEIIRAWGEKPEEFLTKNAIIRGNVTETFEKRQDQQYLVLAEQLKLLIREEVGS